ncbi:unnamed protein product [Rotaria sp. Silwood1]|nr:unnamed protein product [Rotaria sp. Silwood1]CAF1520563.1 unnamed protein product [Rotaria sp. Silwood1]CAF3693123.1 unnamed protein product [Rotaria sp. Silwood1]
MKMAENPNKVIEALRHAVMNTRSKIRYRPDLNGDGKATSTELALFFERFYEEKFELFVPPSSPMCPKTRVMLEKLIQKYNRNSTRNYLIISDLQRTFYELYGLQNQIPNAVYHGLDPEQVHLSYTHNVYNQMFISFVTRERPTSNLRPMIKYCDQGCVATGDTTTYNVNGWHHWIHYILIDNIQPGTKYSYQLGFIESDNKTIPYIFSNTMWTFKTMPRWEDRQREIVYIYGDMGTFMPMGIQVMKAIVSDFINNTNERADYVVHVGDIAYAGTGAKIEIQPIWDLFMNQIAPIASQIPYMTATGNHEKYFNYTSYQTRFFMPSKTDPTPLEDDGNFYFTLETNLVQWIFISTEHNYTTGSSQRLFLENALEQYRQKWQFKQRPWLIVVGHRPMYTSDEGANAGRLQEELEPLVVKYGVDLAVWGHMHCYERTTPVKFNNVTDQEHFSPDGKVYRHNATTADQTSPIHLTIGMSGALINETWFPKPEWSQVRYATFGFGKLYIHNETHLEFKTILLDPTLADEEDRFMIVRDF